MNIFIINSMSRDVPMSATYRGVMPFLGAEIVRVVILAAVPWIVLFLPRAMG